MAIFKKKQYYDHMPTSADEYVLDRLYYLEGLIETGQLIRCKSAAWEEHVDYYDNPDGTSVAIYTSHCTHCGKVESGRGKEAGKFCRCCGSHMEKVIPVEELAEVEP